MFNKKLLRAAAAMLLAGVTVGGFAACSFETPEWARQAICDHVFDEKEILEAPTCGSSGTALKICTECGKTKHVTLSATGAHEFGEWEETSAPTLETPGEKTRTCTVCGKTEKEEVPVLEEEPSAPAHPDENQDGKCDDCGEDIFANATYSAVNAGNRLSGGWYRISALGWDGSDYEFSIGKVEIKLSYDSFTYEMTSGDEPVSVEEVGDHLITITSDGHCMMNDVTASASIKYTGTENVVSGYTGPLNPTFNKYGVFLYISEDCGIKDYLHYAEFSFSGVNIVESSHQLEKVHH